MQSWVVLCWALLALVAADQCPDGGRCDGLSKSFRMVKTSYTGEEDDSVCPDETRCPAEFSCLRTLTKFSCCPLAQGVPCSDGRHCCPEGHQCSANSRSCIRKERFSAVLCPDKVSECPDGTTCCQNLEGKWACCPLEKAVCCEDKTHCCPEGSTCDVQHNKCISSFTKKATPMWAKFPARIRADWENGNEGDQVTAKTAANEKAPKVTAVNTLPPAEKEVLTVAKAPEAGDVPCDDKSSCPDDTTCCKTKTGEWACCPLPQAVCCDDHEHCCPHGSTCGPTGCNGPLGSTPMKKKMAAFSRPPVDTKTQSSDVPCDDKSACPDGSTCCKTKTGEWGCCPLPQAVCCDDHEHCCPHGSTCGPTGCNGPLGSTPMKKKMAAFSRPPVDIKTQSGDVPCDDKSACPDGSTCCKTKTGEWGCCPLPQAVCCDDHEHCCPHGSTCGPTGCNGPLGSTPMKKKLAAFSRPPVDTKTQSGDVPCDDKSACADGTTCCKTTEGRWSCCPLPEAVCCDDHIHCCPKAHTCNLASQTCDEGHESSVPMVQKVPANPRQDTRAGNVSCDSTHYCPDETTCCKTKTGEWACCPLPQAVCCDDHEHCCPHGSTCDSTSTSCNGPLGSTPMKKKMAAFSRPPVDTKTQSGDVPCDDKSACPDGSTCCKTKTGEWGCCPLPQAVCCDDHEHCCPHGSTCGPTGCDGPLGSTPMKKKMAAFSRPPVDTKTQSGDVPCDDKSACPDGSTCCKDKTGEWACCPLPQAVCCDDHETCCPHGSTCTPTGCNGPLGFTPMKKKMAAFSRAPVDTKTQSGDVPCDDKSACADGTTCCKTTEGKWSCCPLPEAVCCDDHIHCCPKAHTCNLASQTCDEGHESSVPMVQKVPANPRQDTRAGNVSCDSTHYCPDETTCCKTKTGEWACCPLPQAVCCDDHEHCCPHGSTCDSTSTSCNGPLGSTPMKKKMAAFSRPPVDTKTQSGDVPCDDKSACPDGSTCCKTKTGEWGCCPLPQAVCCDDHEHCCPHGSTCGPTGCNGPLGSTPMKKKLAAFSRPPVDTKTQSGDVPCDDKSACPDGSTCCKDKSGEWACCPLPQAVCCDDHETCCPHGSTCGPTGCNGPLGSTPMKKKIAAFSRPPVNAAVHRVQCDAHTSCPQATTCCFMSSSQKWGCCPLPEAVCCADGTHCCPAHYKCVESTHTCTKEEVTIPWYTKLPATTSLQAEAAGVQCDDKTECPERTTCCRTSTGEWGCCMMENAVCCSDGKHCCPNGYTCTSASCQQAVPLRLEVVPLTPVLLPGLQPPPSPSNSRDVACDEQFSCPDGDTCCHTSPSSWACCPSPNAVCCSDFKHCCPTGYTCTSKGDCVQNQWHNFLSNKKRALIL